MPETPSLLWSPYENDFVVGEESYITLEAADALLDASLYGEDWGATPAPVMTDPDDPDFEALYEVPSADRAIIKAKRAALLDATRLITGLPLNGRKTARDNPLAFPRTGLHDADGFAVAETSIPTAVEHATAFLAAHLLKSRRDGSAEAERFISSKVGQAEGVYRTPSLDNLPRHVRALLKPFLQGGSSWAPVRP